MIACLHGILLAKQPPYLLIDVNGVGYEVAVSMNSIYQLPDINNKVKLHTHFIVREDTQALYGFSNENERALFRYLIKVNGVGPKLALAILSAMTVNEFVVATHQSNLVRFTKVPGIGKKTAERLLIEMRDKLANWELLTDTIDASSLPEGNEVVLRRKVVQDAVDALVALGYRPQDASSAVSAIEQTDVDSEFLIREALKGMLG